MDSGSELTLFSANQVFIALVEFSNDTLTVNQPGFPCVDCTCPTPAAVELITKFGTGLVMVDNYAHSNTKGGIWIKENWIPMRDPATRHHPFSHVDQFISGFQAYKVII
jgi:hypothetical protein